MPFEHVQAMPSQPAEGSSPWRALAALRARLERKLAAAGGEPAAESGEPPRLEPAPSGLVRLARAFGLSDFERDLLLWCAGVELDPAFAKLTAQAGGDRPTFELALHLLDGGHWDALRPDGPLRYWRLVRTPETVSPLHAPLTIDEFALHALFEAESTDEALLAALTPDAPAGAARLTPSDQGLVGRVVAACRLAARQDGPLPLVCLFGDGETRGLATAVARRLSLRLHRLNLHAVPEAPERWARLARLLRRDMAYAPRALMCDLTVGAADAARAEQVQAARRLLDLLPGLCFLCARERQPVGRRPLMAFRVDKPAAAEREALWRERVQEPDAALDALLPRLADQFRLGPAEIQAAWVKAAGASAGAAGQPDRAAALWRAAREQARPQLAGLAARIEARAALDGLVLPDHNLAVLRDIVRHVRCRRKVFEEWRFGGDTGRGQALAALFSGPAGVGKTTAAEALAAELDLDLYRVDLSAIVSKYIGETEKNLRQMFDAAETAGAVLLFDEADALFGKRTEVRDSHDRYANIGVSYLLQRLETYTGLAILTTNMKDAVDAAFLRRFRFVVHFAMPNAAQRQALWRRAFPEGLPLGELDWRALARLEASGGVIRNIALNAAFIAAEEGGPVDMPRLLRAARLECQKMEKPPAAAELKGWA